MKLSLSAALWAGVASARVLSSLPDVPKGFSRVSSAQPSDKLKLWIALKQNGAAALEQKVLDISTPGHADYGKHLSRLELREFTAPTAQVVADVTAWLASEGVQPDSIDNDFIIIRPTVQQANALLSADFAWYQSYGEDPKLRTLSYSVPDALADGVNMIQPTTRFGGPKQHRSNIFRVLDGSDVAQATTVTPATLASLYNIKYTPTSSSSNLIGFSSYLNESARTSDFKLFEQKYVTSDTSQTFSVVTINGGQNIQSGSTYDATEANLDAQYILGVSHPIPIIEYITGGLGPFVATASETTDENEPYLDFLNYILNVSTSSLPQTLSTSYGEEEQSVPEDYALQVCNLFLQLGGLGVSVLFSSGDSGPGDECISNTNNAVYFTPTFPGACPWITSVGATQGTSPEQAASFSSGGFSIYHSRPSYQDAAVTTYLAKLGTTNSAYFNASNRGFPDVSAQGVNFEVYNLGSLEAVSGTSASSPTFAGVVALLNAARKSQGTAPLGFLNPWLYNNSAALNDITSGKSTGCSNIRGGASWSAVAGWDPVTGLGTPNFPSLLSAAAPGVSNA